VAATAVSWPQVFAWRMRRQFLDPLGAVGPVDVVRRLAGVQAQVASVAELAIALRQAQPKPGAVARALQRRTLLRTWAMRGTLHLLPPDDAGAYLALLAAGRSWERPSWIKAFGVTPDQMNALGHASDEALDGAPLTREELVRRLVERTRSRDLEEQLRSGWGMLLKPLAWQGHLVHGPSQGNRVTFVRPDKWFRSWGGVPDPEVAAATVIPAYLGAHGPATAGAFDRWLTRGVSKKGELRTWFGAVGDRVAAVDVDGEPMMVLAEHVDDLASTKPSATVRLLPGFDQYVLGPGTQDTELIPAGRRAQVSKTAGWIAPVVIARGRVAGVWDLDGDAVAVTLFDEAGGVPDTQLRQETARLAAVLGRQLALRREPR
jgi:hypothetical protein